MKTDKEYICPICGNPFKKFTSLDKTCRNSDCIREFVNQKKEKKEKKLKTPKILALVENSNDSAIKIPKIVKLLSKEEIKVLKGIEIKKKIPKPIKVKGEDYEFIKNSSIIKEKMLDKFGYLFCEECNSNNAKLKWEVHHIFYRSEVPNHEKLHSLDNLILLCSSCHKSFHDDKKKRNHLVKRRGLDLIFGKNL